MLGQTFPIPLLLDDKGRHLLRDQLRKDISQHLVYTRKTTDQMAHVRLFCQRMGNDWHLQVVLKRQQQVVEEAHDLNRHH